MEYYHTILNLLSLVLVLSILFIVLFGCQFKKYRRIERFTDKNKEDDVVNDDNNDDDKDEKIKKEESKDVKDETKDVKDETIETLEGFEGQILSGLTQGTITSKDMDKFINAGTFTKENLENIISYVEKFKSQFS
jgi:hypothetical protein